MSFDPANARQDLEMVERAERAARRNSIDNGMFYLVWGFAIVIGRAAFERHVETLRRIFEQPAPDRR